MLNILMKNLLALAILFSLFSIVSYLYPVLLNQMVWYAIALTVNIICTAGLVYCMLNKVPMFKMEKNEYGAVVITEYFMRGQRS